MILKYKPYAVGVRCCPSSRYELVSSSYLHPMRALRYNRVADQSGRFTRWTILVTGGSKSNFGNFANSRSFRQFLSNSVLICQGSCCVSSRIHQLIWSKNIALIKLKCPIFTKVTFFDEISHSP